MKNAFVLSLLAGLWSVAFCPYVMAETVACAPVAEQAYLFRGQPITIHQSILKAFADLTNAPGGFGKPSKLVVRFGVDAHGQPVAIQVTSQNADHILKALASSAVMNAAPYPVMSRCNEIILNYKPTPTTNRKTPISAAADTSIRNQYMAGGAGDDTYGYSKTMIGDDQINDTSGKSDKLVFGRKSLAAAKLQAMDGDDQDSNIDALRLDFGDGNSVTINHYFNNTSHRVQDSGPGPGLIESIRFVDGKVLDFNAVRAHLKERNVGTFGPPQRFIPGRNPDNSESAKSAQANASLPPSPKLGNTSTVPMPPNPIGPTIRTPASQNNLPNTHPRMLAGRKDPAMDLYATYLQSHILRHWNPLEEDRQIPVVANFRIDKDGGLHQLQITHPSYSATAEKAAVQALQSSAPFRALPSQSGLSEASVTFVFYYPLPFHGRVILSPRSLSPNIYHSSVGAYNQNRAPAGGPGLAGIDPNNDVDFGPYVAEMQRRIRRNWTPPVEDRSKRVVVLFHISRDGRLLGLSIMQSSGAPAADQAAIAAIRATAPFRALPSGFRRNDIAVQFIFDYEIQGHGSARLR